MTNTHNKNVERGEVIVWSHCMQFKLCCYHFKIEHNIYKMFYVGLIATKIEHLCWKKKKKKRATANKEWYIQKEKKKKKRMVYPAKLSFKKLRRNTFLH